jgi:hypothetical protein
MPAQDTLLRLTSRIQNQALGLGLLQVVQGGGLSRYPHSSTGVSPCWRIVAAPEAA